jgi:archaellum biogenesis ATPase FlaH
MQTIETLVILELLYNIQYVRKVIPYIKPEYFENDIAAIVFKSISEYFDKYNEIPTKQALSLSLSVSTGAKDAQVRQAIEFVSTAAADYSQPNQQWIVAETEKWCKDRSVFLAVVQSIDIIDGKHESLKTDALPKLLSDALSVSFDSNVGHDFFAGAEERYEFYHNIEEKIPFDLSIMNTVTVGGLPRQTLNILLGGTGTGKTMVMCHMASAYIKAGVDVLYITLEMAEQRIAERIDANLMNVPVNELTLMSHDRYMSNINLIHSKTNGRLIVKQYPTGAAHVGHFRALLSELKMKQNFIPTVIIIDYIGICSSSRYKHGSGANSYTIVKAVAEEVRGLAVESNSVILTAVQTNRGGYSSTDTEMTDISESFGITHTADFMAAIIRTEELDESNQILLKILKNRYNDIVENRRFVVGVDRSRMLLYDVDNPTDLDVRKKEPDVPAFDKTRTGRTQTATPFNF